MRVIGIYLVLTVSSVSVYGSETYNMFLGTADPFAILGATTVTNTGDTQIFGNLGLYSGTSITGFPPGVMSGTVDDDNAIAMQAEADALTAYNSAAAQAVTTTLTGEDLGGLTLTPGVYFFSSSAQLTGKLTLNDEGNPDAVFIFQIGSTLTTAADSSVVFSDSSGQGGSVTWQVGSSATLGAGTSFAGTIIADDSITMVNGATIDCGRAFALTGAVTLDTNTVSVANSGGCMAMADGSMPEPGTAPLLGIGLLSLAIVSLHPIRRWKQRSL
ncbi:MAG TPA: ice-binding family protein [Bryobacteraceae bacterium]|jgi:type VI secretion system secreted protein VgrG